MQISLQELLYYFIFEELVHTLIDDVDVSSVVREHLRNDTVMFQAQRTQPTGRTLASTRRSMLLCGSQTRAVSPRLQT